MAHSRAHAFVAIETVFGPAQSSARTINWSFGAKAMRSDSSGSSVPSEPAAAPGLPW
jgi:hypothetical protein